MGTVYRALVPVIHKTVALKYLDPFETLVEVLGMENIVKIFTTEAQTMAGLNHPYIIDVWDFDHDRQGRPFFIMEYFCNNLGVMIGEHYRFEKKSRIIPPEKVIYYGRQLLEGLSCLHENGIIHRDLKPYNILVTDQDSVKICDFGMSKQRGEKLYSPYGLNVGSPHYAAPEQQSDPDHADERSDLYSVAVLLYRMLTGELQNRKSFALSKINPLYDSNWDSFFHKGLDWERERRFQSCTDMLTALQDLHKHLNSAKIALSSLPDSMVLTANNTNGSVRYHPIRGSGNVVKETFQVDDLFQPLTRLDTCFHSHSPETVKDESRGLIWQKTGSPFPMDREKCDQYIETLNKNTFAKKDNWRLPTVNELLTLTGQFDTMNEPGQNLFSVQQPWFWSCDWRSPDTAWYVNLELGYTGWQESNCRHHVLAVSSQQ